MLATEPVASKLLIVRRQAFAPPATVIRISENWGKWSERLRATLSEREREENTVMVVRIRVPNTSRRKYKSNGLVCLLPVFIVS